MPCSGLMPIRLRPLPHSRRQKHRLRMIEFSAVHKRYPGGYEALRGVSFTVGDGELVFITGHSGAGKSTLLKLIQ